MPHFKIILSAALLTITACAPLDPREGFDDIKSLAEKKINSNLIWNADQEAADQIDLAVRKLLSQPLTADDVVQIALLNNPSIQAVYEDVGIAQADLILAGLLQNPVFLLERRFPGKALEIDIAQDFVDLFLIPLRTKVAENKLEATKLKVVSAIVEHAAKTKESFYELQSSLQQLELYQVVNRAMEASAAAAKKLYLVGNIKKIEMQEELTLANETRIELAIAENDIIEKREHLNVLMGLWSKNINWKTNQRLPALPQHDPEGPGLERLAIQERLDLASERKELDALGNNISLSGYGAILTEATLNYHSEIEPSGDISRGPSISLPIPIFNQGSAQQARAYAQFRQYAAHFTQHAIEIRSEVRRAFQKMILARKRTEYLYRVVLPLKGAMLEQTQLQYNGMFMSVFQLLQAKRSQIEAGKQYIDSLKEYWVAKTALELAVGGRIKDVPVVEQLVTQPNFTKHQKQTGSNAHHHPG